MLEALNKPLALAVLSIVTAVSGRLVTDHFAQQATSHAQAVRLEALERNAITRAEFHQFAERILDELSDLKIEARKKK